MKRCYKRLDLIPEPLHKGFFYEENGMQLIDRALSALEILSRNMNGMSVSELSAELEIPASSTHRILASLKANHFVFQDEETRKYRLGYKVCGIASGVVKGSALTLAAKPYMKLLAQEIDRNVVLCVMEHHSIMNISSVERNDSNMYMVKIGYEMPIYATSAGRIFAAYMERQHALELLSEERRTKTTPYTKTSLQDLDEELDRVRKDGYALIDEELQLGMQGVACPIFDVTGEPAAALAFTTVKEQDPDGLKDKIERLLHYAEEISHAIC